MLMQLRHHESFDREPFLSVFLWIFVSNTSTDNKWKASVRDRPLIFTNLFILLNSFHYTFQFEVFMKTRFIIVSQYVEIYEY